MPLPQRYDPSNTEPAMLASWQDSGVYHFAPEAEGPIYAIDTPPPSVSGYLHLGHVYSYSHPDFMARFWRMRGYNVFYPMGYDDNGLPTERLVERQRGITAPQVGRPAFIQACLEVSEEAEKDYEALWQRLGLSIDWRYTYRTIDDLSRRTSQLSFVDLYHKGLVYRQKAPTIWCPECRTAIAQAELNDLERQSEFITLPFTLANGQTLEIATTRPELLPACVAVFVHPSDERFRSLVGQQVTVPFFGQTVPLLTDPGADPEKGTGAVMCCTFGDTADVGWWYTHNLPLVVAIGRDGRMTEVAGDLAGLPVREARQKLVALLDAQGLVLGRRPLTQSVRVHERCDTPVEYAVTQQWFIRVLDQREALLQAGEQVAWYPASMQARYRDWVENLGWDWCISRQRYFGVPFPLWYCNSCGETILADAASLPVDPAEQGPGRACSCGSTSFTPEEDVMDTWATSSLTPQIVGRWLSDPQLYQRVFPFTLRPQAHEIIRTWAFYTIVKAYYHFGAIPWKEVLISGWGLAGEGVGKISKSRGGGPMAPLEMIERYSADAVRYWAASTGPGKDAIISEEKIQTGTKLVTKLWNVARLSERFLADQRPPTADRRPQSSGGGQPSAVGGPLSPADRWILARLQQVVRRVTELMEGYDYAAAKSEVETFFWGDLADNYLEMAKQRLYDQQHPLHAGATATLYQVLLTTIKLFAPFLPYVTDEIYQGLFAATEGCPSIHRAPWPQVDEPLMDAEAEAIGERLVELATAARRYKSTRNLSLGTELTRLRLATSEPTLLQALEAAIPDLMSVTRAKEILVGRVLDGEGEMVKLEGGLELAIVS
jgi:valyl-tRNA synthetase